MFAFCKKKAKNDFKLSKRSLEKLLTCDKRIQKWFKYALSTSNIDFAILDGARGKKEQDLYYKNGKSGLKYPNSKHNKCPSLAVDIAPYPIDWDDIKRFNKLSKHIKKCAKKLNLDIIWGGDWRRKDRPHWELA